jgi:hypothetical protein
MSEKRAKRGSAKTRTGFEIPVRKRSTVLADFEKAAGPLRGQNRDQKPKA